jgi:biopolymer transport protein ExbB/biopolymer transport protein TolQ
MLLTLFVSFAHAAAEEETVGFGLMDIWNHSGWLARGVIVMLFFMLLGTIVVSIERQYVFNNRRKLSMSVASQVVGPLTDGDIEAAIAVATKPMYKESYLASLLAAGLTEIQHTATAFGISNAKRATDKAINEELSKLRRGMTILATVGSTAPFVGLFGTTFGVINAFDGMATEGSGLSAISAGISEALITTGVGIGVAVVGVWAFNYFNLRAEKISDELASSEADLIDWAEKHVHAQTKAGK